MDCTFTSLLQKLLEGSLRIVQQHSQAKCMESIKSATRGLSTKILLKFESTKELQHRNHSKMEMHGSANSKMLHKSHIRQHTCQNK